MEKQQKKKKNSIERDRISNLPDFILHRIFSFLNIEEAVQSSVLSKRWRYLWTSLPTLIFDLKHPRGGIKRFVDKGIKRFVDKVLTLRDGSNIQKFSFLCLFEGIRSSYVNDWIISALRRNVEELVIGIIFDDQYRLPNCLFNSKSLTILNLSSWYTHLKLTNVPDSMCLPSLKTMFLDSTEFVDDDQTNRFFSSCPVLESLTITNSISTRANLKISSLSLKHLMMDLLSGADQGRHDTVPCDGSVKLYTPNLISFHCKDYMEKNYDLENLSSLFKAYINLLYYHDELLRVSLEVKKNMYAQRMLKFLGALHNVTDLTIWSASSIPEVISGPTLLESNPIYRNLRSLKMDAPLSGDGIHTIICLLQMSPAIETLYINFWSTLIEENWEVELPSECLLNHLKRVEIRSAEGSVNDLKFLETLLKNAVVLETLMFVFGSTEVVMNSHFSEQLHCEYKVVSAPALLESNPYCNRKSLKMDARLSGDCTHTIICLLQMFPAIETLFVRITEINFNSPMIKENWEAGLSSECLLNHLKRVEIQEAIGSVNELKFLETLLKNAVVLETLMIVFASTEVSVTDRKTRFIKFGEKLRAFRKASSSITIMLI